MALYPHLRVVKSRLKRCGSMTARTICFGFAGASSHVQCTSQSTTLRREIGRDPTAMWVALRREREMQAIREVLQCSPLAAEKAAP